MSQKVATPAADKRRTQHNDRSIMSRGGREVNSDVDAVMGLRVLSQARLPTRASSSLSFSASLIAAASALKKENHKQSLKTDPRLTGEKWRRVSTTSNQDRPSAISQDKDRPMEHQIKPELDCKPQKQRHPRQIAAATYASSSCFCMSFHFRCEQTLQPDNVKTT